MCKIDSEFVCVIYSNKVSDSKRGFQIKFTDRNEIINRKIAD